MIWAFDSWAFDLWAFDLWAFSLWAFNLRALYEACGHSRRALPMGVFSRPSWAFEKPACISKAVCSAMETLSVWGEPTALHVIFHLGDTGIVTDHEEQSKLLT